MKNPKILVGALIPVLFGFYIISNVKAESVLNKDIIKIDVYRSEVLRTEQTITRVSIANPKLADVTMITPNQILIVSKEEVGATNLIIWHGDDFCKVYDVVVYVPSHIKDTVQKKIKDLVPGSEIDVSMGRNNIILSGTVDSLEMQDRVLNVANSFVPKVVNLMIVQGSQQVQIEVTISEVNRSAMKKLGLGYLNNHDWGTGVFLNGTANSELLVTKGSSGISESAETNLSSLAGMSSPYASAFQILLHSAKEDTLGVLSILQGQGLARILANPTLVSMSGQEANFNVGGEFPIPITGSLGQTTIQFRQFGIKLIFTPTVVGKETITMKVETEVSSPDYSLGVMSGGVAVPGLKSRQSSTTMRLKDGQTFAMAGLLKEETATVINKIPYLGNIPILGTLFTSKQFQKNETELVISVTPRLVRALNREEVTPLPHENFDLDMNDNEFFLLNGKRLDKGVRKTENGKPVFIGKIGFCEENNLKKN